MKHDDYIFVYGTLRRDTHTPMHDLMVQSATDMGPATWQGRLYLVSDWYPGAVPSDEADDIVFGEVYQLHAPELILPVFDRYEGCDEDAEPPHEYVREKTDVTLQDGTQVSAWIYRYNQSVSAFSRISSGDFLAAKLSSGH